LLENVKAILALSSGISLSHSRTFVMNGNFAALVRHTGTLIQP
jgi:hypothetical protein